MADEIYVSLIFLMCILADSYAFRVLMVGTGRTPISEHPNLMAILISVMFGSIYLVRSNSDAISGLNGEDKDDNSWFTMFLFVCVFVGGGVCIAIALSELVMIYYQFFG